MLIVLPFFFSSPPPLFLLHVASITPSTHSHTLLQSPNPRPYSPPPLFLCSDSSYSSRWVTSNWKKSEGTSGEWAHVAGPYHGDAEEDKGIQTSQDARFYAISSAIAEPFSNNGKTLVFQFQVRFPQSIDCGGGYVKLLPTLDQAGFNGDSDYSIMFGPDICGTTKRTHFILNYKGKNHLIKREIRAETDKISHVYTMILNPDNTYEVRIDGVKAQSGSLSDDWDLLAPKTIKDPAQSKPADWVDEAMIE
jgi:calreticulin